MSVQVLQWNRNAWWAPHGPRPTQNCLKSLFLPPPSTMVWSGAIDSLWTTSRIGKPLNYIPSPTGNLHSTHLHFPFKWQAFIKPGELRMGPGLYVIMLFQSHVSASGVNILSTFNLLLENKRTAADNLTVPHWHAVPCSSYMGQCASAVLFNCRLDLRI